VGWTTRESIFSFFFYFWGWGGHVVVITLLFASGLYWLWFDPDLGSVHTKDCFPGGKATSMYIADCLVPSSVDIKN
jgi:hypothetical protein